MIVENFIGEKPLALTPEFCQELIVQADKEVELQKDNDYGYAEGSTQFPHGKLGRDDWQLYMPQVLPSYYETIQKAIFEALEQYKQKISSVAGNRLVSHLCKLQKTPIGGGFSVWHTEHGAGLSSLRSLVWCIYLNTIEEGGETEFLYQGIKAKAEQGKLVIFPAGITHPHRGNPPYSSEKYILTGWFEVPLADVYDSALVQSNIKG